MKRTRESAPARRMSSIRPSSPGFVRQGQRASTLLVSFVVYAPATVLFVMARREQGRRLFSPGEVVILIVSVAGALSGIVALAAGWISI